MNFDLAKAYQELDIAWDGMKDAMTAYSNRVEEVEEATRRRFKLTNLPGDTVDFRIMAAKDQDDLIQRHFSKYNFYRSRVNMLLGSIRLANEQQVIKNQEKTIQMLGEISEKLSRMIQRMERL